MGSTGSPLPIPASLHNCRRMQISATLAELFSRYNLLNRNNYSNDTSKFFIKAICGSLLDQVEAQRKITKTDKDEGMRSWRSSTLNG